MVAWLKFYFLGFFSDKYSGEGARRSFWNLLLSFVLTVLIVCTGLFTGFMVSFDSHYQKTEDYREFIYNAFSGISLEMKDGRLSADIPDADSVNGFIEEGGKYSLNGYSLILDTRPAATTYAEFSIICKDSKENEVSYDYYLALSDSDKKNYTAQIEYSGKSLDVTQKQDEYENYLNEKAGVSGKSVLAELKQQRDSGAITQAEYDDCVYAEYVKAYYPTVLRIEQYGKAPTLRTYYLGMVTSGFSDKFLMLLDDVCVGAFTAPKNLQISFEGYYYGLSDGVITNSGQSAQETSANLDKFISGTFKSSGGYVFLMFVFNMFKLIPVVIIAVLILAFAVFIAINKLTSNKTGYLGTLKIIGSYLLVSSLLSFVISIILSFGNPRGTVYLVSVISLIAVVVVRTVIYAVRLILAERRAQAEEEAKKQSNS